MAKVGLKSLSSKLEWQKVMMAVKFHGLGVSKNIHIIPLVQLIQVGF